MPKEGLFRAETQTSPKRAWLWCTEWQGRCCAVLVEFAGNPPSSMPGKEAHREFVSLEVTAGGSSWLLGAFGCHWLQTPGAREAGDAVGAERWGAAGLAGAGC